MRKEMVQICNYIVGDKAIIYELLAIKKAANKKPKNRDSETALSLKTESSRPGPPGGGGRATQRSFIRGGSAPRSKPLPFDIPFFERKGTPFVYLS